MATRNPTAGYPLLAICCAGLVLFGIAATIVLALIPLYLPQKTVTDASLYTFQKQLTYSVQVPDTLPTGKLSDSELAQLTQTLQSSQTGSTKDSGTASVTSAEIVDGSSSGGDRKRRQGSTNILIMIILATGRTNTIVILIENHLTLFIQQSSSTIVVSVVSIINSRTTTISPEITTTTTVPSGLISTTTIPPGLISTTAAGRRRRRHQVYEGSTTLPLITYQD